MTTSVADDIRTRRKKLGLSQADLSTRAKLQANYVCRLEGGEFAEPSYKKVVAIQGVLEGLEQSSGNAA